MPCWAVPPLPARPPPQAATPLSKEGEVLRELARIIDPDFGMTIVDCGFVKVRPPL